MQLLGGTSYTSILSPWAVSPHITALQFFGYQVYDYNPFAPPPVTETLEEKYQGSDEGYEGSPNEPPTETLLAEYQGGEEGYEGSPNDPPGVTTTPEPSTIMLLGTGMAGVLAMGVYRRRKNRVTAE